MISIVLPTHNRKEFLKRAIRSVTIQTFQDWELLVIDDGSEEPVGETVERFQDRRVHYVYQVNGGVSRARNNGIRLARFPWICFLDSDDSWRPDKLHRQLDALRSHPLYRITYSDEIWIRRGRRVNPKKIHRKYGGWIFHRCLPLCIISPSSVMIHRQVLEREGVFDESFPICEDYELWLRLACRWPVFFLEEPLITKVGGHADQLSKSDWGLDRHRLRALIKNYNAGHLSPQQALWTAREIARKAHILSTGFANRGKSVEALDYCRMVEEWSGRAEAGR